MKACCAEVIARYKAIWGKAAENAALYCSKCGARLEYHNGHWTVR